MSKPTNLDLLLAAQVRSVAKDLKQSAFAKDKEQWLLENPKSDKTPYNSFSPAETALMHSDLVANQARKQSLDSFTQEWESTNTLDKFLLPAMLELKRISDLI